MKTIKKVRVRQMEHTDYKGNTRPVANQFRITTDDGVYFQSYKSIIAFVPNEYPCNDKPENESQKIVLDANYWDYSQTTGRYRNQFLGDSGIAETRKKIADGTYLLADLNG